MQVALPWKLVGNLPPWGQQETLRTEAHKQNNKIIVWGYGSDS